MAEGACNVIYLDRRAKDEHVWKDTLSDSLVAKSSNGFAQSYLGVGKPPPVEVHANVDAILSIFNEVHICGSGNSCLAKLSQLSDSPQGNAPTIVLIDIPYDEEQRLKRISREPRTPSPTSTRTNRLELGEPDDIYGMHLLVHLTSEIQSQNISKLVVPVVLLSGVERDWASIGGGEHGTQTLPDTVRVGRYLDAGAVDVTCSPLSKDRVHGIVIHAYRIHKEVAREQNPFLTTKRNRKLSWVGVNDAKPYAYLREAMVTTLMGGICNPETVGDFLEAKEIHVEKERQEFVASAVGRWDFAAHDFTDDELLYGALLMMKHTLQMPELEQWRISDDNLMVFLLASRNAYNDFVLYHNFRHVVDVLQALFHFLVRINVLPPYGSTGSLTQLDEKPPIAQLLRPFEALTLLISAIGHDVGHPGVNNAFLVALNAPLAQLYNDRSVLESFHCAAYSQILRRYWPVAFADSAMRKLMINNILATDMGLHFKYMSELGNMQQKLAHDGSSIDTWNTKIRDDYKDLTCGLLIKCADISNVARKFNTAARWAVILTDEFSNQGVMESELQIPTCLFGGPPVRDDLVKLGESQLGFINIFAMPLFAAVSEILPNMHFSVEEILRNRGIWEEKISEEKEKSAKQAFNFGLSSPALVKDPNSGPVSPLSGGALAPATDLNHSRSIHSSPHNAVKAAGPDSPNRRSSTGSFSPIVSASRRSSVADRSSRRSSGVGAAVTRSIPSQENQSQSRRGSGDASLTAILVTQAPSSAERQGKDLNQALPSSSNRQDHSTKASSRKVPSKSAGDGEKDGARPLTAPSSARRTQGTNLFPLSHPHSQSHSEVDLPHSNGNLDGSKSNHWSSSKHNGGSATSQSDTVRESNRRSDWWRPISNRRRTKIISQSETNGQTREKDIVLDSVISNPTSATSSPSSPTGKSRSGKIKSFFKRKPKQANEQEKQLSSYGSSSQLRTPPTSDPGLSLNSED